MGSSHHRIAVAARIAWTVVTAAALQTIVCAIAIVPIAATWRISLATLPSAGFIRLIVISALVVPSYVGFALMLMPVSALSMRLAGWQTPAGAEMRIADQDWPLLNWARALITTQVVRVFSGTFFRGTPVWSWYLRLAGARIGRRVYVNSLGVNDYNLLDFGDGVVIGADVHLSGHTVEAGVVKTARVTLGRNVTIGLCSIVEIGVTVGDDAQVGAMSFVPKHAILDGGRLYAGVPATVLVHQEDEIMPSPHPMPWLVALAGSAGALPVLIQILKVLPQDLPAAVVIVQHRATTRVSHLEAIIRRNCRMPVTTAAAGGAIEPGHVYIARADSHLTVTPHGRFQYHDGRKIRFVRSSANPLLESAAQVCGGRVIAVVLSGGGMDATDGVQTVKAHGGLVIAQNEATAQHWSMPRAAVESGAVNYVLAADAIAPAIQALLAGKGVPALASNN